MTFKCGYRENLLTGFQQVEDDLRGENSRNEAQIQDEAVVAAQHSSIFQSPLQGGVTSYSSHHHAQSARLSDEVTAVNIWGAVWRILCC